jgi:tetratricopeptide (TPR) repeat protein
LVEEAVLVLKSARGPAHPSVVPVLEEQAGTLRMMNRLDEAEKLYREILELRRTESKEHCEELPKALNNLAIVRRIQGDLDESEALYREALDHQNKIWGPEHPSTLLVLQNLAGTLSLQKKYGEAEEALRQIVDIRRKNAPEGHWRIGSALVTGLGRLLIEAEKYEEAEPVLREGVAIWEAGLGGGHSWTVTGRAQLATCLYGVGKTAEADTLLTQSLIALRSLERLSSDNRVSIGYTIEFLERLGRTDDADRYRSFLKSKSPD